MKPCLISLVDWQSIRANLLHFCFVVFVSIKRGFLWCGTALFRVVIIFCEAGGGGEATCPPPLNMWPLPMPQGHANMPDWKLKCRLVSQNMQCKPFLSNFLSPPPDIFSVKRTLHRMCSFTHCNAKFAVFAILALTREKEWKMETPYSFFHF